MEILVLTLAGSATALATGIGAVPVCLLKERVHRLRPVLWGVTAGMMGVASIVGLLLPALDEGKIEFVVAGVLGGTIFLLGSRKLFALRKVEIAGLRGVGGRRSLLVFTILFVHSFPEGCAIGTAFASDTAGLSLFVFLAIALQNIPEGTCLAIPLQSSGMGAKNQFWSAVLTSAPQPVGAVAAFLFVKQFGVLLPISFAFAAGAMLTLVLLEIVPEAFTRHDWPAATGGALIGALIMIALAAGLGI